MSKLKLFIQIVVMLLSLAIGISIGKFLVNEVLPNVGATMITVSDIAGCYVGSVLICLLVGGFIAYNIGSK